MFGNINKSLQLGVVFFAIGCAQPKYLNADQTGSRQSSPQESKSVCANQFQNSGTCLTWAWEKEPTQNEAGSFLFKTYRLNSADQTAIEMDMPAVPLVVLWMPSMGHGSSPTQVERLDVGTYRAKNVFFVMPGEWEIKFQIKQGNAVSDESIVPVDI